MPNNHVIPHQSVPVPVRILFVLLVLAAKARGTPWEDYLNKPTPDRAKKVVDITYAKDHPTQETELDLMLLEVQILSRDREAVRLGFRLRSKLDGAFAENNDIALGRLIRIDPKLFLRELNRAGLNQPRLDSLVGNPGPEYVDRLGAEEYEINRRVKALQSVSEPELAKARDLCLVAIRGGTSSIKLPKKGAP